jgi:hypothetical protein
VQPRRRPEGHRGRQLHAADAAELLDLLLFQPAVAADRELALDLAEDRVLQRAHQILDVTELPGGTRSGDDEEPGRLEVAGQRGVRAADQDGGPDDGDVEAGMGTRRAAAEPLDLQQVADAGGLGGGTQLRVLGQRDVVVRQRAVDHGRRAQHDAVHAGGGRRGQDGLRAAHVVRGARGGVALQVEVEREVHHHVDAAQPVGDGRVAHVEDVPGGVLDLAAALVDRDDLLDLLGRGEPARQQVTDPCGGAGDGHDGAAGPARGCGVSRSANLRFWGTHRASPAVVFSTWANDAYVPGDVHPAADRQEVCVRPGSRPGVDSGRHGASNARSGEGAGDAVPRERGEA